MGRERARNFNSSFFLGLNSIFKLLSAKRLLNSNSPPRVCVRIPYGTFKIYFPGPYSRSIESASLGWDLGINIFTNDFYENIRLRTGLLEDHLKALRQINFYRY